MDSQIGQLCDWEEIPTFSSYSEFCRFRVWIDGAVADGAAQIVDEDFSTPDRVFGMHHRFFKHTLSGIIWVLSCPDGPWHGSFLRLESHFA
jgi:hypothetical protein